LARATVVSLVERLREKDLVDVEDGRPGPGGGRPGTVVRLKDDAGFALAIHFGHQHVRAAAGNLRGYQVYFFQEQPVDPLEAEVDVGANAQQSLRTAVQLIKEAMKGRDRRDLVAVTVGWPAPVKDVNRGEVMIDSTLKQWLGIGRPADRLQELLDWPDVTFLTENDANLGAIMELEHGAGLEYENFLYVHWNSGMGGATVIDGEVRRGASGLAAELGHIPLSDEKPRNQCLRCGSDRCLEVLAGGMAVAEKFNERTPTPHCETLSDVIEVASSHGEGAEIAKEVLQEAAYLVGKGLGSIVTWENPAAIVIGGHFGRGDGPDHFGLISEGLLTGLGKHTSAPALEKLQSTTISRWRYGAAQGGVVLGLREGLSAFVEERHAMSSH
jgi:predicted NBD/HSP70 family sugar kinase